MKKATPKKKSSPKLAKIKKAISAKKRQEDKKYNAHIKAETEAQEKYACDIRQARADTLNNSLQTLESSLNEAYVRLSSAVNEYLGFEFATQEVPFDVYFAKKQGYIEGLKEAIFTLNKDIRNLDRFSNTIEMKFEYRIASPNIIIPAS